TAPLFSSSLKSNGFPSDVLKLPTRGNGASIPLSSTNLTASRSGFDERAIRDVVIASFLASTIPECPTMSSIVVRSPGVKSVVVLISISAVIKALASVPTARVRFWISDRRATTDPTPRAIHRKKKSNRLHDERISRRVRLKINLIILQRRNAAEPGKIRSVSGRNDF